MYRILLLGILLSVLIFINQKNRRSPVRYLAGYFFSISLLCYFLFLFRTDLPPWSLLFFSFSFLLLLSIPGVFAFFYVVESSGKRVPYKWLHFAPAVLMVLNFYPLLISTAVERAAFYHNLGLDHTVVFTSPNVIVPNFIFLRLRLAINLIYLTYALVSLIQAYKHKKELNYIWFFSFIALNALVVVAANCLLSPYFNALFHPALISVFSTDFLLQGVYVLFLAIFLLALFFPKIIYEKLFLSQLDLTKITNVISQKSVVLSDVQLDAIEQMINKYLIDKPYLDANFSKAQLLVDTQISWHHLSAYFAVNNKSSFSHWKSELQIMESISMVQNGYLKKHTIASLSNAVGFQSRSRFSILFKQYAGCSPKELAKQN